MLIITISIIVGLLTLYILKTHNIIKLDCVTYKYFNILCPACGVTRMIRSILEFNFSKAFRYNQLVFVLIPYMLYIYTIGCIQYINDGKLKDSLAVHLQILAFILIIWGVIRNIPGFEIFTPNI